MWLPKDHILSLLQGMFGDNRTVDKLFYINIFYQLYNLKQYHSFKNCSIVNFFCCNVVKIIIKEEERFVVNSKFQNFLLFGYAFDVCFYLLHNKYCFAIMFWIDHCIICCLFVFFVYFSSVNMMMVVSTTWRKSWERKNIAK